MGAIAKLAVDWGFPRKDGWGPKPDLPDEVLNGFIQAVWQRHSSGKRGCVGKFLRRLCLPDTSRWELESIEDRIRDAESPELAIQELASTWGFPWLDESDIDDPEPFL